MKLFKTLLCALFLLMFAATVGAVEADLPDVDPAAATAEQPSAETTVVTKEASAEVKQDCDAPAGSLFQSEWIQPAAGGGTCGSCSSANCNGAFRGQPCWTGNGWGHCNIYSGGYRCSTGGWDCDCGVGPLP